MLNLEKINLSSESEKKELKLFLESFGLALDNLDCAFVFYNEQGRFAACGGKEKNVLKCFAVKEEHKGEGLLNSLLSAVLKESYNEGFKYFFVFTKTSTYKFFLESGFEVLEKTRDSVLLFRGDKSPLDLLKELYLKYCPVNFNKTPSAAIVVNANPFTLGHRYLAEQALKECGKLYIFVVETDKSFFSFTDRFYLVKKNTEDLKNVCVLPSSEFLISAATFPSYFLKDESIVLKNHVEMDSKIFLKYFVPVFNISTRFLGEEPFDMVTRAYNESLLNILPPACKVKIIKRLQTKGKTISASFVRNALNADKNETLKQMVPPETFQFLKTRYKL